MVIVTIAAANHVPRAVCLARSLSLTQREHTLVLCLVERDTSALSGFQQQFHRVVRACDLDIPNFEQFIFRHSVYEACKAIKARVLLWLMQAFPDEQYFLYLDPDIDVYSRFEELDLILRDSDIVVTPHQVHDEVSRHGIRDNLCRALIGGTFNLGFLAIRRCKRACEFLDWWDRKLRILCYMESDTRGLFVDQKWALMALSFFDMTVLREPGYNVGNWNVSKRDVTVGLDREVPFLVNGRPLRFFHFSGIDGDRDLCFLSRYLAPDSPVFSMRSEYLQRLREIDSDRSDWHVWSYAHFCSGEPISTELRFLYRNSPYLIRTFPRPFKESAATFFLALAGTKVAASLSVTSTSERINSAHGFWKSALRRLRADS